MAIDLERYLATMVDAMQDADATLELTFGGLTETTRVRLWRSQVLVDWEPDEEAGDCLLRPELIRRLAALGATVEAGSSGLRLRASPRAVAKLSHRHASFGAQLGGPPALRLDLHFDGEGGAYRGGSEAYVVARPEATLLSLRASVEQRPPRETSAQTGPGSA